MAASSALCQRAIGVAATPDPTSHGVPRRIGPRNPDGRYLVLCQSHARWRVGPFRSCDRCLTAMADLALTGHLEVPLTRFGDAP